MQELNNQNGKRLTDKHTMININGIKGIVHE